jgi:hypothetical protein
VPAEPIAGPEAPNRLPSRALPAPPAREAGSHDADLEPIGMVEDADIVGTIADGPAADSPDHDLLPPTPAHARLGSEGVSRLRARYSEVLARISERTPDPIRQEQLKAQAERLNPDTWVTDAEVSAGLEEYETVFEALRSVIGGPVRRRRRRKRGGEPQAGQSPEPATGDAVPNEPAEDERTEDL